MNGAREYCKVFTRIEQIGRLYIVPSSHARGKTLHIYVLPKGIDLSKIVIRNPNINQDIVEVYGIIDVQPGWTESYGWLHLGKWKEDFEKVYQQRLEKLKHAEIKERAEERAQAVAKQKHISGLLADYEVDSAIPISLYIRTSLIPFKNHFGYWMWRMKEGRTSTDWPGLKPPNNNVIPKVINGKWYWVNEDR